MAAIIVEAGCIGSYARMQRRLLRSGGLDVPVARHLAVAFAARSLSITLPGGQAFAMHFKYGQLRGFRNSFAFILAGHLVFTLPFMVRTVSAAFSRPDLTTLEEAARSLGANFRQRFLGILVPAVLPSIAAGSLMVFTLSVGEFNLTWMLHTPLTRTLPVGLADSYASMRLEVGSAYTLIFFIVVLPVLWALQWLVQLFERRHGN